MIIPLPWPKPPPGLTQNQARRTHYYAEAAAKKVAKAQAVAAIRAADVRPVVAANVTLHWRMPDRRRRDGDGADVLKKVLLDALVDSGVLPGDSWVEVPHSGTTCHPPEVGKPGAMWLTLTDVVEFEGGA